MEVQRWMPCSVWAWCIEEAPSAPLTCLWRSFCCQLARHPRAENAHQHARADDFMPSVMTCANYLKLPECPAWELSTCGRRHPAAGAA